MLAGCGPESTEVVVAEEMSAAVTPWSEHAPPHEPEVVAPIPERREAAEPYEPEEWHYSKESDPCETLADEARKEFRSAYLAAGAPRLAFVTSMTGPDVVGGKTRQETGEALRETGEAQEKTGKAQEETSEVTEAAPSEATRTAGERVDLVAVENHFIDFFHSLADEVQVVDLDIARAQMEREVGALAQQAGQPWDTTVLRDRNLCDVAVFLEVRIARDERVPDRSELSSRAGAVHEARAEAAQVAGVSRRRAVAAAGQHVGVRQGVAVEASQTTEVGSAGRITVACTARAVRVEDGTTLAVTMPERYELVDDEVELGEALDEMSFCGAASLADRLASRLSGDARMPAITVRLLSAETDESIHRLMEWIREEFPGSRTVFRSYSRGAGEFSVQLNGSFQDLVTRARSPSSLAGFRLQSQRAGARSITFVCEKN
jgi:hypothetical protein